MKCDFFQQLIPEYLDGDLVGDKAQQLESHLNQCRHCQAENQNLQSILALATSIQVEYPDEEIWNNFWPNLHQQIKSSQVVGPKRTIWSLAWRVAACLILGASIFILAKNQLTPSPDATDQLVTMRPHINVILEQVENELSEVDENLETLEEDHRGPTQVGNSIETLPAGSSQTTLSADTIDRILTALSSEVNTTDGETEADLATIEVASLY